MKVALSLIAIALAATVGTAQATPQQDKMKSCNAEAKTSGKTGDERKDFMKECLSAKPAAAPSAKTTQQEKMKSCNKEAGEKKLKGAERKSFMSQCLKA